jgi:hypothetical protein
VSSSAAKRSATKRDRLVRREMMRLLWRAIDDRDVVGVAVLRVALAR